MEEDFAGVAGVQQRHGWGGRIGVDMGNTCVQWGCKGVACGVRGKESSEGHSKGRNNKIDGKKKKR